MVYHRASNEVKGNKSSLFETHIMARKVICKSFSVKPNCPVRIDKSGNLNRLL